MVINLAMVLISSSVFFFAWVGLTLLWLTVFNQKTLYNAYKKRTKNVEVNMDDYNKMKEADPEFYREASSLLYGKVSIKSTVDFQFLTFIIYYTASTK